MLEELRTANNDVIRGGIIVEPLPTVWRAGITVALDSGVAPDSAACTLLVNRILAQLIGWVATANN
jgi:hypothetical protein